MSRMRFVLLALASIGALSSAQPVSAQYYGQQDEVHRRQSEDNWLRRRDADEAQRRAWEDHAYRRGQIDWRSVVARRRAYDREMANTRNQMLDQREEYDERAYRRGQQRQNRYRYGDY